jgi:hypothetical protein
MRYRFVTIGAIMTLSIFQSIVHAQEAGKMLAASKTRLNDPVQNANSPPTLDESTRYLKDKILDQGGASAEKNYASFSHRYNSISFEGNGMKLSETIKADFPRFVIVNPKERYQAKDKVTISQAISFSLDDLDPKRIVEKPLPGGKYGVVIHCKNDKKKISFRNSTIKILQTIPNRPQDTFPEHKDEREASGTASSYTITLSDKDMARQITNALRHVIDLSKNASPDPFRIPDKQDAKVKKSQKT